MKLVLASQSPRRRELLLRLGIPFEVISPRFEEAPTDRTASDEALFFAEQKARSVADRCPGSLVIGSDTLIDCCGRKLGKPRSDAEAKEMLRLLSGKTHQVYTAVVLLNTKKRTLKRDLEKVDVTFRSLSPKEIDDYVATGEPIAKAGGYAIQGKGRGLIDHFEGIEAAVVGLPLEKLREWLIDRR